MVVTLYNIRRQYFGVLDIDRISITEYPKYAVTGVELFSYEPARIVFRYKIKDVSIMPDSILYEVLENELDDNCNQISTGNIVFKRDDNTNMFRGVIDRKNSYYDKRNSEYVVYCYDLLIFLKRLDYLEINDYNGDVFGLLSTYFIKILENVSYPFFSFNQTYDVGNRYNYNHIIYDFPLNPSYDQEQKLYEMIDMSDPDPEYITNVFNDYIEQWNRTLPYVANGFFMYDGFIHLLSSYVSHYEFNAYVGSGITTTGERYEASAIVYRIFDQGNVKKIDESVISVEYINGLAGSTELPEIEEWIGATSYEGLRWNKDYWRIGTMWLGLPNEQYFGLWVNYLSQYYGAWSLWQNLGYHSIVGSNVNILNENVTFGEWWDKWKHSSYQNNPKTHFNGLNSLNDILKIKNLSISSSANNSLLEINDKINYLTNVKDIDKNNIANLIIKNIDIDSIKDVSFSLINDDYDVLNNVIVSMYKNIYNAKKEVVFSYNGDIINIFDRISVSGVNGEYVVISTTNKEFNQDIRAWSV